jgi:ribosomal protein S18 acetylase RimI-like enzyme/predicted RNA methylase
MRAERLSAFSRADEKQQVAEALAWSSFSKDPKRLAAAAESHATDPDKELWVWREGDRILGVVALEHVSDPTITISRIGADPAHRRQGLGRRMVEHAARLHPASALRAETDKDAVGFYRRLGFRADSLGEKYPGIERFSCTLEPLERRAAGRYDDLIEAITRWAESDPQVRLAVLIGSQARPDPPADRWSDLDVVLLVRRPEPLLDDAAWPDRFGDVVCTFTERAGSGPWTRGTTAGLSSGGSRPRYGPGCTRASADVTGRTPRRRSARRGRSTWSSRELCRGGSAGRCRRSSIARWAGCSPRRWQGSRNREHGRLLDDRGLLRQGPSAVRAERHPVARTDLAAQRSAAGSRALDLGCGTGRFSLPMAASPGYRVTGADSSAEMLGKARRKDFAGAVEWVLAPAGTVLVRYGAMEQIRGDVEHTLLPPVLEIDGARTPNLELVESWLAAAGLVDVRSRQVLQRTYLNGSAHLEAARARCTSVPTMPSEGSFQTGSADWRTTSQPIRRTTACSAAGSP